MDKDIEDYVMQLEKRMVYLEGRVAILEAAKHTTWPIDKTYPPIPDVLRFNDLSKCNTCGITFTGAWGYVCNHPKCPTIAR
jgi:hypothetical protein